MKNRFLALLLTLVMAIGFTTSAFADEPAKSVAVSSTSVSEEVSEVSASEEVSPRASLGDVIAAGSTTINGGSGVLYVTLPSWNLWADIVAGIGYAPREGVVTCTVITPDGDTIYLGAISGTGSTTRSTELAFAHAGTYTFHFSTAITDPIDVFAYIYD